MMSLFVVSVVDKVVDIDSVVDFDSVVYDASSVGAIVDIVFENVVRTEVLSLCRTTKSRVL